MSRATVAVIALLLAPNLAACVNCPADAADVDYASSPTDSGPTGPSKWSAVAVGQRQACGITTDGELRCWGQPSPDTSGDEFDLIAEYLPRGRFVAITMDGGWSDYATEPVCARAGDGSVVCWGYDHLAVNEPMKDYRDTHGFACGIRSDTSKIECQHVGWDWPTEAMDTLPPVARFRMWDKTVVGVTADGSVVDATESKEREGRPRVPHPPGPWKFVDVHSTGFCGVDGAGALDCWGYLTEDEPTRFETVPAGTYTDLCVEGFACALGSDSHVSCWGEKSAPPPTGTFTAIACGVNSACGVTTDQEIECWGACGDGECDVPE